VAALGGTVSRVAAEKGVRDHVTFPVTDSDSMGAEVADKA